MHIFEAIMLICFGAAWPVSIYKSLRSKSVAGKSLAFLVIINIGYISGIIYKLNTNANYVLYLYVVNAVMVFIDILLYVRNSKFAPGG